MIIKTKNNFLNKKDFKNLKDPMLGTDFPWYYNSTKVDKEGKDNLNNYQLTHTFFFDGKINSGAFNLIEPILQKLKVKKLIRVKANLVPRTFRIHKFETHLDQEEDYKAAILYMNTNNGYTYFNNGGRHGSDKFVNSKENTIVLFKANQRHYGTTCTNEKIRVLINFNYQ